MSDNEFPAPQRGFVVTHFLVVSDQDRSREFYRSGVRGHGGGRTRPGYLEDRQQLADPLTWAAARPMTSPR